MTSDTHAQARAQLRRLALAGLVAGPLLLLVGVTGALSVAGAEASESEPSVAYAGVFFVAVCIFGVIELVAGVVALRAASRLPNTATLASVNDVLTFATAIVAVVSTVAMMVLNEPPVVLLVVLLAVGVWWSLSAAGKAMSVGTTT